MHRRLLVRAVGSALVLAFLASVGSGHANQLAQGLGQANAPASGSAPEAGTFIVTLAERAVTGLARTDVTDAERDRRFRELFREGFDVPAIARFVLGRYWRAASEAERSEYMKLFEELIVQTYSSRFTGYAGESVRIINTRAGSDGEITVVSELARPSGAPVRVDWRVFRTSAGFKIYDVAVEGVSMSVTQRDDFAGLIQSNGGRVENLLTALREKVAQQSQAKP